MVSTRGNISGSTPIAWGAHNGHEEVVKILHGGEEGYTDKLDNDSETPLSDGARNGHEGMAKIPPRREKVNLDTLDIGGRTPLPYQTKSND